MFKKLALSSFMFILFLLTTIVRPAEAMNKMPPPEIKLYPLFGRECPNGNLDCLFKPKESIGDSTIYFSCKNSTKVEDVGHQYCFCGTGDPPKDELMWPLEWNGQTETCSIAKGGLCGQNDGLHVTCLSGMDCLEGRCRNREEIKTATLNQFCNDELDCAEGLVCSESIVPTAVKTKRCYSP